VRIGNSAESQFQLDVFGELMDALHSARCAGMDTPPDDWEFEKLLVDVVARRWREPDNGIWEARGERQDFVHSKVMAWVAVDRAVRAVEDFGLAGPVDRWKKLRAEIHEEVMIRGVNESTGTFKRSYESRALDAALLVFPMVGFIEATADPMRRTIEAIEETLVEDGFLRRYRVDDGLPGQESSFLMCTLWLANCLVLLGRSGDAQEYFERVLKVRNDLGMLSEQYDTRRRRLAGNFPQAFSHTAVVATARAIETGGRTRLINRHLSRR
jgi:GH15 family glucan-1,4-alpha-glucosidase